MKLKKLIFFEMFIFKWFYNYSYIRRLSLKTEAVILVEKYTFICFRIIDLVENCIYYGLTK